MKRLSSFFFLFYLMTIYLSHFSELHMQNPLSCMGCCHEKQIDLWQDVWEFCEAHWHMGQRQLWKCKRQNCWPLHCGTQKVQEELQLQFEYYPTISQGEQQQTSRAHGKNNFLSKSCSHIFWDKNQKIC